jgi:hypothetical protein
VVIWIIISGSVWNKKQIIGVYQSEDEVPTSCAAGLYIVSATGCIGGKIFARCNNVSGTVCMEKEWIFIVQ